MGCRLFGSRDLRASPKYCACSPFEFFRDDLLAQRPLDRVLHQFARILQRQLVLDVGLVGLHGLDAEVQFFGDLPRAVAFADQAEDFQFAVGKICQRMLSRELEP